MEIINIHSLNEPPFEDTSKEHVLTNEEIARAATISLVHTPEKHRELYKTSVRELYKNNKIKIAYEYEDVDFEEEDIYTLHKIGA